MSTLYERYTTGDNTPASAYGDNWWGQGFTPSTAHTITSVKLLIYRVGSPGNFTVSIRSVLSGANLCSGTIDGDTLTTDTAGEWTEITFLSSYSLLTATYYIVARAAGGDISNQVCWRYDNTGSYAGGHLVYSVNGGADWSSAESYDFMFQDWGVTGWANIAKVQGIASANIAKVNGVAVANIAKLNGISV